MGWSLGFIRRFSRVIGLQFIARLCQTRRIQLARQLYGVTSVSQNQGLSPEAVSAALHNFDNFWKHQADMLTDRCRLLGMPTIFIDKLR